MIIVFKRRCVVCDNQQQKKKTGSVLCAEEEEEEELLSVFRLLWTQEGERGAAGVWRHEQLTCPMNSERSWTSPRTTVTENYFLFHLFTILKLKVTSSTSCQPSELMTHFRSDRARLAVSLCLCAKLSVSWQTFHICGRRQQQHTDSHRETRNASWDGEEQRKLMSK